MAKLRAMLIGLSFAALAGAAQAAPAQTLTLPAPGAPPPAGARVTLPTPNASPAAGTRVVIFVSCVPNAAALTVSGCRAEQVTPPEFAPLVSDNAVRAAAATKLAADWSTTLQKDGDRVILPVTVMARPLPPGAGAAAPLAPVATTAQPGDVVITVSCAPQADNTLRDCSFVRAEPADMAHLQSIALSTIAQARLADDWRTRYTIQNGRVLLPVRLSRRAQ